MNKTAKRTINFQATAFVAATVKFPCLAVYRSHGEFRCFQNAGRALLAGVRKMAAVKAGKT